MAQKPLFPCAPVDFGVKLANSDGTGVKDLAAASGDGVMIGCIRACSDCATDVTLQFSRTVAGVDHVIGEAQVPAGSGTNGSAGWVDVLAALYKGEAMNLPGGSRLRLKAKTAVPEGRTVDVVAEGGRF